MDQDEIPALDTELRDLHGQLAAGLAVDSPADERSEPYWDATFATDNDPFGQLLDELLQEQRGEINAATKGEEFEGPWTWRKPRTKAE
jgi:hypothetical protein